jgi:REP element-mobilizing transposase RayT
LYENSQHLFGSIENGEMTLNSAGEMIQSIWSEIPLFYNGFVLHDFVVMPNHFHGVIEIVGTIPLWLSDIQKKKWLSDVQKKKLSDVQKQKQLTIPQIIHRFKTLTTRRYIDGVNHDRWEGFQKQLWQRSYHEHIIRDEKSYEKIVQYVQNNPLKWVEDCYFI